MGRNLRRSRRIRFEPNPVINSVVEALFASEVSLSCLNRDMAQQELYLLQFTTCLMAKTGTGATEVMGRQSWNLTDLCFLLHHAQMTFGLKPQPQTRPALLIDRSRMPSAIPAAAIHASIPALTSPESGWCIYGRPCQ